MNNEDRYHTTSWDGRQVQRQSSGAGSGSRGQSQPRPASGKSGSGKKKPAKKRTNPLLALILWVVIVAASSAILAGVGWMLANDLCALNKEYKEVTIEVPEEWVSEIKEVEQDDGTTKEVTLYDMGKVSAKLKEEGLIEYGWFFRLFAWVYHADEKIAQGTYTLDTDMDYMALIRGMRSQGGTAVTVEVAIPEGYNVNQIIALLAENGVATEEALTDAAANYEFQDYPFLDAEQLGSVSRLEGYLFPDTYEFYVGASPVIALDSMLSNFNKKVYANEDLAEAFEAASERGYSLEDIIIIASLIEKETDGSDRDKIASVIYNRLENAGETAYLLQIDAALVYAAGRAITQEDYTSLDSPYNLYQHTGLPPTAIANPGISSITAALNPADTNYYFYVLGADGKHVFSETLAQHEQAVAAANAG